MVDPTAPVNSSPNVDTSSQAASFEAMLDEAVTTSGVIVVQMVLPMLQEVFKDAESEE